MTIPASNTNVAARLTAMAAVRYSSIAVVEPARRWCRPFGYRSVTFGELDADSTAIAAGLAALGVGRGTRLAILVRPGIDFISIVFGAFKCGSVAVLIDPGMGPANMVRCLEEVQPAGFIAISPAQAVRTVLRRRFRQAALNVTVGRRWFWGGPTLAAVRRRGRSAAWAPVATAADDPAAIIFTTGSTGPPKGVLYRHGNFDAQVDELRDFFGIRPGEIDLPCFPLFALFNCALGATAVIPDMDPSRPARVRPERLVRAIADWRVTQAFGSPAIWNRVGPYCRDRGLRLPSLKRVMSAGAPVPVRVLAEMKACIGAAGEVHTPYGATEALPVASIAASEVLRETAARTAAGAGVCVGRHFPRIEWRVIAISDAPLPSIDAAQSLPAGQVGELIVRGPVVTTEYVTRVEANALAKVADPAGFWHRMGDAGYLDDQGRFWFCGRVAHRVLAAGGPMYTIPCEAIFNGHERVARSALVGIGPRGRQRPVVVVEPKQGRGPRSKSDSQGFADELKSLAAAHAHTAAIGDFLFHPALPVDIRHNAKIFREKLAVWAAGKLS